MQARVPATARGRRATGSYEVSAFARPGRAVPPQPQLLALRRLPRHRRRRARQAARDAGDRPRRADRARQRSRACPGSGATWRAAVAVSARGAAGGPAVRVHAERAAPDDGFDAELFEARTGPAVVDLAGTVAAAEARGLLGLEAGGRWAPTALGSASSTTCRRCSCPKQPAALPGELRRKPCARHGDRLGTSRTYPQHRGPRPEIRHVTGCSRSDMLGTVP